MYFDPDALPVPDLGLCCQECGSPLAHLDSHHCPECGREFELDQFIPEFGYAPPMFYDGKQVMLTTEIGEFLNIYGIPVQRAESLASESHLGFRSGVVFLGVPREFYLDALFLLCRRARGERLPPPPLPQSQLAEEWECPKCSETNPPNFDVCWHCGRERTTGGAAHLASPVGGPDSLQDPTDPIAREAAPCRTSRAQPPPLPIASQSASMYVDPDALPVPDLGLCCRGCGYLLQGLDSHRCPECGRPFTLDEFVPEGGFLPLACDGKEVILTPEVVGFLRRYDILCLPIEGESANTTLGLQPAVPRMGVARESYFDALYLLQLRVRGLPLPPPQAPQMTAEWKCDKCGEPNPGTFDICWNCQSDRPQA